VVLDGVTQNYNIGAHDSSQATPWVAAFKSTSKSDEFAG